MSQQFIFRFKSDLFQNKIKHFTAKKYFPKWGVLNMARFIIDKTQNNANKFVLNPFWLTS